MFSFPPYVSNPVIFIVVFLHLFGINLESHMVLAINKGIRIDGIPIPAERHKDAVSILMFS